MSKIKEEHSNLKKKCDDLQNTIDSLSKGFKYLTARNKKTSSKCKRLIMQIKTLNSDVVKFKLEKEKKYQELHKEKDANCAKLLEERMKEENEKFLKESDMVYGNILKKNEEKCQLLLKEQEENFKIHSKKNEEILGKITSELQNCW